MRCGTALLTKREEALVLLRGVQPEHGVQPVERSAQLDDVLGVRPVGPEVVEELAEPSDLMTDLHVAAAHGAHCVVPEHAGERRVELGLLGPLVRLDFLDEQPDHAAEPSSCF